MHRKCVLQKAILTDDMEEGATLYVQGKERMLERALHEQKCKKML